MQVIKLELKDNEKIAFCCDIHADSVSPSSRIDNIIDTLDTKLDSILSGCKENHVKYLFFEGDIFNRVQCPHEVVNRLGRKFMGFIREGIQLFTILGNHDIIRNNLENLEKSPIQTLFEFGVIKHLNLSNRVVINRNVLINPVDYTEYPVPADKRFKVNILLAHMFYEVNDLISSRSHNLKKEDIDRLGYDAVFLGHDHEEYPITKEGSTYIIRSGSVLRGTSHSYNFKRVPKFVVLDDIYHICPETIRYVEIEHKDYKDIASEYVLNKKVMASANTMSDMLNSLTSKLLIDESDTEDRIYSIIMSDNNLSNDSRELLLKYIAEEN